MIDALQVVETLPNSTSVAYGFVNGKVALPAINTRLADGDTEATLKTELSGLVAGSVLSDGVRQITVSASTTRIDISAWNRAALVVTPPSGYVGIMKLQVLATTTELGNGSTASNARELTVQVLSGTQCATPACMNPYVALAGTTVPTVSSTVVLASSLADPDVTSIVLGSVTNLAQPVGLVDNGESMEAWLRRLSQSLGSAFDVQMEAMFRDGH